MIPPFSISGALPPFVGPNPADRAGSSPYVVMMSEIVRRFGVTAERVHLLTGLLNYREELRRLGVTDGEQWINGSFVEDIETTRGRPPADVDVITLAVRPVSDPMAWSQLVQSNRNLFDPQVTKARFNCDAYFVDLSRRPNLIVADATYFFGLFSHQRVTSLWKGMLAVLLASDDQDARLLLLDSSR